MTSFSSTRFARPDGFSRVNELSLAPHSAQNYGFKTSRLLVFDMDGCTIYSKCSAQRNDMVVFLMCSIKEK